jgi:hypothetical protein
MSSIRFVDVVSVAGVGRTSFIRAIGSNYDEKDGRETSHDKESGLTFIGMSLDKYLPVAGRPVILLYDQTNPSTLTALSLCWPLDW